jgi:hypothetical protein
MARPGHFIAGDRLVRIGVHGAEAGFDLWPHFLQGHLAIAIGVERAEAGIGHALGVFGVVMAWRAAARAVAGATAEGAEFLLGEIAIAIGIGLGEAGLGAGGAAMAAGLGAATATGLGAGAAGCRVGTAARAGVGGRGAGATTGAGAKGVAGAWPLCRRIISCCWFCTSVWKVFMVVSWVSRKRVWAWAACCCNA